MTEFEKLTVEMVAFLRGKYRLDEVAGMYYDVTWAILPYVPQQYESEK